MRLPSGLAKAVLLLFGGIPAAIGIAAGQAVAGVLLTVVAEVFVLLTTFAAGIVKELSTRWRARLIDLADQLVISWVSQFGKKYHEYMLATLRLVEEQGPATTGFYRPTLDEIYVDVSVFLAAPHQVSGGLLPEREAADPRAQKRRSLTEFLDKPTREVLAVIGGPGSGKTTLLRRTARETSRNQRDRRRRIPILLYLRDHVELIIKNPAVDIATLVHGVAAKGKLEEPTGWFERRLRAGNCVVMLDGLDEVARKADRRAVAEWIDQQITQYHLNDFVITSRPQGYLEAKINAAATSLQVQDFTDQQVIKFIRQWYWAIERRSADEDSPEAMQKSEEAARDLLDRLNHTPALYELTVNPLLLTMIANVHRYRGALPGSRADLYSEICQVMLWRRHEAKKLAMQLRGDKKEALLQRIAFLMMTRQTWDIPVKDLITEIRPAMRRLSSKITPEEFLADVGSNGLLVEREAGVFSFAHQTFQEFLTASYIKDKGNVAVLCENVDEGWWREATLLYAARSDADEIVRACLQTNTVTSLSLAIACADQESDLEPELRERIEKLLDAAFEPDVDPEWRTRLAGVIVGRQLRDVVRTRDGSRVCVHPVTTDMYHLFQQDTGAPPPDAVLTEFSRSGDPVLGVRATDAIAFERWVNRVSDSQTPYQLADLTQLTDPAVHRAIAAGPQPRSIWALDAETDEVVLWTPPRHHPHRMNSRTMKAHVTADVTQALPSFARLVLIRALIEAQVTENEMSAAIAQIRSRASARGRAGSDEVELAKAKARGRTGTQVMHTATALKQGRAVFVDLSLEAAADMTAEVLRAVATAPAQRRSAALEQGKELAAKLAADLDPALAQALAIPDDFVGFASVEECIGRALSRVLSVVPSSTVEKWAPDLASHLAAETIVQSFDVIAAPDVLIANARQAADAVLDILHDHDEEDDEAGFDRPTVWACRAAAELEKVLAPVVNRETPITASVAMAVRLSALCLAAEPIPHRGGIVGQLSRDVAAGITLLQRRATGMSSPSEMIVLAPR